MQHLRRELRRAFEMRDVVGAIPEFPMGSRSKRGPNRENGVVVLDPVLFSSLP